MHFQKTGFVSLLVATCSVVAAPIQGSIFDPWDFAPHGNLEVKGEVVTLYSNAGVMAIDGVHAGRPGRLENSASGEVEIMVFCFQSVHLVSGEVNVAYTITEPVRPVAILAWENITIDMPLDVDARGASTMGKPITFGGASYGGIGSGGAPPYGDSQLTNLFPGSEANSLGGGALELCARGTLTINSRISADGNPIVPTYSTGGSGGALLLAAQTVVNNGTLSARGGGGRSYPGGGGGRIAIYGRVVRPGNVDLSAVWPAEYGTSFVDDQWSGFGGQLFDLNLDGSVDAADVTTLVNYINVL